MSLPDSMRPESVVILGKRYAITYCERPSDVDMYHRESYWGQIDYWTRTIRIYDFGDRQPEDLWHTLIHEVLHGVVEELKIEQLKGEKNHDALDILALAIVDVLFRNGWIKR